MSTPSLLEDVFKKWEKRGEERRLNVSKISPGNVPGSIGVGRAAWSHRFDSSSIQKRRMPLKRKKQTECPSWESIAETDAKFQLTAPLLVNPMRSSRTLLTTGCPKCANKSKMMYSSDKTKGGLLCNILDLSVFCRKNLFRNTFSHFSYVNHLSWPENQNKIKVKDKTLLESKKVKSTIERLSEKAENSGAFKSLVDIGSKILTAMISSIKPWLVKLSTWFLLKFFGKVITSIQVHEGQLDILKAADKQNVPIIYLPLHKSHVDYILISFILSCRNIKVPYIVAGDNLKDIPIFSYLMRNMGGFFIKRSNGDLNQPDNELYKAVLDEYMTQILESGNSLEVYIEGTRSRSGKCYLPKIGVLSTIVSSVLEGRIPDVLIVPVNISYEKIFENGYSDELLGRPKKTESFFQVVTGIWRIFNNNYGQVAVNFGLPCSLKEYLRSAETSKVCQSFMKTTVKKWSPDTTSEKHGQMKTSQERLPTTTSVLEYNPVVSLSKSIAHHVVYDCVSTSTIMSTNVLAFLLLTKFRNGVKLEFLEMALEATKKDILLRKRDYGFSGSNKAVIKHALDILGDELVSFDSTTGIVKPNLCLPNVLNLSYYGNQVLSVFALESVVACSICALLFDQNITLPELVHHDFKISRRELLDTGLDLCELLYREFIFSPPCVTLEERLLEAIERFIASDIISVHSDQATKSRERQWANRIAASTVWSDDDDGETDDATQVVDQEYKVNSSEVALKKIAFFCSVLAPIVECYWFVACCCLSFKKERMSEKKFTKEIHDAAIRSVGNGTAFYSESCSLVFVTNAVKIFQMCDVLKRNETEGVIQVVLKETEQAAFLPDQISRFKL